MLEEEIDLAYITEICLEEKNHGVYIRSTNNTCLPFTSERQGGVVLSAIRPTISTDSLFKLSLALAVCSFH